MGLSVMEMRAIGEGLIDTGAGSLDYRANFVPVTPRSLAVEQRAEILLQRLERADFLIDFFEVFSRQLLDMDARLLSAGSQGEQGLYFLEGDPQRLRALHKQQ